MIKALQEGKTMKTNVDKRLFFSKNSNIIYDGKQANPYKFKRMVQNLPFWEKILLPWRMSL
jgi:hypothetical protein